SSSFPSPFLLSGPRVAPGHAHLRTVADLGAGAHLGTFADPRSRSDVHPVRWIAGVRRGLSVDHDRPAHGRWIGGPERSAAVERDARVGAAIQRPARHEPWLRGGDPA